MNNCIVHIGMHKTGSSSIQRSLQNFEDAKFLYADLGEDPNHSLAVYTVFATNPEKHHLHRSAGRGPVAVREYADQVRSMLERSAAAARGRTLVISGEDIGVLNQNELKALREFLEARFDNITIAGYIRPPASFMASSFQQLVKTASARWFDPQQLYREYQRSFGGFDSVFGRDRVKLWKFDPKSFPGACVVQDFGRRLGIAIPKRRIVRVNESLSRGAVSALYTYAKFGSALGAQSMRGPEGMRIGVALGDGADKFRFSGDLVRSVLNQKREDIAWMEARLGETLHEETAPSSDDVRDEQDLLRPDPTVVQKLRSLLGDAAPADVRGRTSEEVAKLVHAYRTQTAAKGEAREERKQIRIPELLDRIRQQHPAAFVGVPQHQARTIAAQIFKELGTAIAETSDGVVTVSGFGRFRFSKVEKEVDGVKTAHRRIIFLPAEAARPGSDQE
jgi:hypothetical protein